GPDHLLTVLSADGLTAKALNSALGLTYDALFNVLKSNSKYYQSTTQKPSCKRMTGRLHVRCATGARPRAGRQNAANRMLCIRGKHEKRPDGKACFPSGFFIVFIAPVGLFSFVL
ncbi:MAG: hypothetical protein IJ968_04960, partial [Clostridia bacterium]|nr:hypothetical protein [Clostridia bacterium]